MPKPRFRLRTLVIIVGLVALGLGGELTRRRGEGVSRVYRSRAGAHRNRASAAAGCASIDERKATKSSGERARELTEGASLWRRYESYHRMLTEKYRKAALWPWTQLDQDPPPPGGFDFDPRDPEPF